MQLRKDGMRGLGRLRLVAKGQGQTTGDVPHTLQRLAVGLEDGGMVARIAANPVT